MAQLKVRQIRAGSPQHPYPRLRGPGLWQSAVHAWSGLIHTVAYQRNMRIHIISAILVGLVGMGIPLGLAEKVTLIFCVLLIFSQLVPPSFERKKPPLSFAASAIA